MQLCDAFDIPLLYLCDTPGIMVGPEIEKTALVRHSSRMFLIGANLDVPVLHRSSCARPTAWARIAMAGGSYKEPFFTVAWPTGEFGGMGLEGSVKLGYRNELAAIEDPEERLADATSAMVAQAYERGKALNNATRLRHRRHHRPGRVALLGGEPAAVDPAAGAARGQEARAIDAW